MVLEWLPHVVHARMGGSMGGGLDYAAMWSVGLWGQGVGFYA